METVTNLNNEVIKLTGKDIDNKIFAAAIHRLCNHSFSDPKISYNLGYISKKIQSFTKDIMKEHGKLVEKYSDRDEDGKILMKFSDENQEKYAKDLESIHGIEHEIRKRKLDVNLLSQDGFKFTANDISALEPLLCGLED